MKRFKGLIQEISQSPNLEWIEPSPWDQYRQRALNESEIAFDESGNPPMTEREKASHKARIQPTLNDNEQSEKQVAQHDRDTLGKMKTMIGRKPKTAPFNEEYQYKVGDRVIPHIGMHRGLIHKVTKVHDTGHISIAPHLHFGAPHYHELKVNPKTDKIEYFDHGHGTIKQRKPLSELLHSGVNRRVVQEAFKAGKDKKNPPKKDDSEDEKNPKVTGSDIKNDKSMTDDKAFTDKEPDQAEVQAKPPQFGGEKDEEKPKKTAVTPTPEKKTAKIDVKGPGPDDKFQADPIVTPVISMPDISSPKSGSQGVK